MPSDDQSISTTNGSISDRSDSFMAPVAASSVWRRRACGGRQACVDLEGESIAGRRIGVTGGTYIAGGVLGIHQDVVASGADAC